jgi:uncharacterized protein (DUF697 family)/tellurite resistance protein
MNEQEQRAILAISLMAAFADGDKDDRERAEIKRIADSLAAESSVNVPALYQDVLLGRLRLEDAAADIASTEGRQLAYEMAVCVCDADDVLAPAERGFLEKLRVGLGLSAQEVKAHTEQAEAIAASVLTPGADGVVSSMSDAEIDKAILSASILNGALELLPETLATMAIIPLQMKLVYRIGRSYGFELDRGHIKDFLATAGVGLGSQYLEQAGRKLLGGLIGKIGGRLLGGIGKQAVSSGMSFASTYALGMVAKGYYASNRSLNSATLRDAFNEMLGEAKSLSGRYLPDMQKKARTLDLSSILSSVRGP